MMTLVLQSPANEIAGDVLGFEKKSAWRVLYWGTPAPPIMIAVGPSGNNKTFVTCSYTPHIVTPGHRKKDPLCKSFPRSRTFVQIF